MTPVTSASCIDDCNQTPVPIHIEEHVFATLGRKHRRDLREYYEPPASKDESARYKRKNPGESTQDDSIRRVLKRSGYFRNMITLKGKSTVSVGGSVTDSPDPRFTFLIEMYNDATAKVRHFDELRQKYMNYALLIFAGLMGVAAWQKMPSTFALRVVSVIISVFMVVFCLFDRHLHKLSHQWQAYACLYYEKACDVMRAPSECISYYKWDRHRVRSAELFSFQPVIYYILIAVGAVSCFLWPLFAITK